eukprot:CAMPEP_0181222076 /NCGR_PEP_ID=MMETSP1096-20121128/29758_1 /TAXON_ID=156174 ORGANISM="Chrysochromulina ericina, Strain CCMP281" /NCGR_SAMPLE_ID=MMETSP1096 /ASSEMBLY_ACC=CAM_ASM_000453 /LENGTH=102 /DNA_ID=CAMNT_0023314783 /DNA_START=522 /DNA_END=830 /DNA_ORIENTATION=-
MPCTHHAHATEHVRRQRHGDPAIVRWNGERPSISTDARSPIPTDGAYCATQRPAACCRLHGATVGGVASADGPPQALLLSMRHTPLLMDGWLANHPAPTALR